MHSERALEGPNEDKSNKELLVVAAGLEPAGAVKVGLQDGAESHGVRTNTGLRDKTHRTMSARWGMPSVGYAEQVVGRAGAKSALTILYRCEKCGFVSKDDFMWFVMRKREPVRSHKSHTRCCCAYCGAPGEHETGTCIVAK